MKNSKEPLKQLLLGLALIATGSGLTACSKVNRENYDKLRMGMDYGEVVQLLGEPEQCESLVSAKSCTWGKPPKTITVQLVGDKVILYQGEGL
jgi:hypothetical protein